MQGLVYTPYTIPALGSAVICLILARFAWVRRPSLGATFFSLLSATIAFWSLAYAIEIASVSPADKILWAKVQYAAIVSVPVFWLLLALQYGGRDRFLNRQTYVLLAIGPLITFILVLTNESHHLIWQSTTIDSSGPFVSLDVTYGIWFWIHVLYSYGLILIGSFSFLIFIHRSILPLYRWQAIVLLTGVLAPWVANGLYIVDASPIPNFDITPIGFMVSGLTIALGILRFRLFDIVPVARRAVFDGMREGMLVLDLMNRIVDMNQEAGKILDVSFSKAIGKEAAAVIADNRVARQIRLVQDQDELETEMTVGKGDERYYYEVRMSPLYSDRNRLRGRLLLLHDVTRQKTAEVNLLTQKQLFQNLVAVARATTERPTLEATLQNALDVAVKLTRAELGSLFVLDSNNVVTNSILSRGVITYLEQKQLVGQVMDQGVAGWVSRHREAVLIDETLEDDRWLNLPDSPYVARSVLAVPILGQNQLLGTLTLQHSSPSHFTDEDMHLMQASADQMALALRNARIYDEQRRLAKQQSALYETLRIVGGHLEPGTVIHAAAGTVASLTGWTAVAILVPDDARTTLQIRAASGILSAAKGRHVTIRDSICGQVFLEARTVYVPDVSVHPNYVLGHAAIKSQLAVPIQRGEQMLGVLDVESDQLDGFMEADIRLAESLAETIGLALDNAHLFRVLEDERSRLQALIQSNRDGVILVGIDQRILVMNQLAHELLRLPGSPDDWVNRSMMEALAELFEYAPLAAQATMAGMRYMNQGIDPPSSGEIEVEPRTLRWQNSPVKVGNSPIGRLLSLVDITEERLLEHTRDDLTHTMVHDLRNPLNNIFGAQEMLSDLGPLNEEQKQVLEVAKDSTQRMLALIKSILDISRLESGRMPLERKPLDLRTMIERVVESQLPLSVAKDIHLGFQMANNLDHVFADELLVDRILTNLVGNALKFTPLGGNVLISAGKDIDEPGHLFVRVQDTGPGIPAAIQDRIFQKFTTGKHMGAGSGLGLAFCKMAVEAHGGRIWAKSWPGEGASLTFTLPVAASRDLEPASKPELPIFQTDSGAD